MRIDKVAVLSTAHVTAEDAKTLDAIAHSDDSEMVQDHGYGWHVVAGGEFGDRLSPSFYAACQLAMDAGCLWIRFDRDEAPIDELETHDW